MIFTSEMYYFLFLAVLSFLLLFFLIRTLKMIKRKRVLASCRNSVYLLVILLIFFAASLVGVNILTYHRLTHETPIASLHVKQLNHQQFQVNMLLLSNCEENSYVLQGDEWQIDARIIKWHGWVNILGLDAAFQLDRISGRYRDIEQQRQQLPSAFALEAKHNYDLWALKKKYQWLPWLDARYGQSVFLPMKDKQNYQISMTQSGLISRKQNSAQSEACL